ncbi:MAG: hypothetical protein WKF75_18240 [Singulisphaera sp.]
MHDPNREIDSAAWLAKRGLADGLSAEATPSAIPPHFRLAYHGVPLMLHRSPTTRLHDADDAEREEFLRLYEGHARPLRAEGRRRLRRKPARPGGSRPAGSRRRRRLPNANFNYNEPCTFSEADHIITPSQFAADYYRERWACTAGS